MCVQYIGGPGIYLEYIGRCLVHRGGGGGELIIMIHVGKEVYKSL